MKSEPPRWYACKAMLSALVKPPAPSEDAGNSRVSALRGKFMASLPALLLALALATVFLFNSDRERFYAPLRHDTVKSLSIAENLSPQHRFRMFTRLSFDENGEPVYKAYNRFPIGGFALIKLAILPFGDNLAMKVFAARMLMLAFLSAAAFLAYHALARIASSRWIALTATMIAFSSYYILHYSNWVSNEFMIDLFAVMLVFHGMVVFYQEGRFRQLAVKTCIALLIGWHVYAFLAPFIALGLGKELVQAIKARRNANSAADAMSGQGGQSPSSSILGALKRSRYLMLGVVALLFGVAILGFNFLSEYDALSGEVPLTELPSVQSFAARTGLRPTFDPDGDRAWGGFLYRQFHRIAGASIPYGLMARDWAAGERLPNASLLPLAAMGVVMIGACLAGLLFIRRNRIPLAALALSGLCWALPLRNNTFFTGHQFEAIYYVGVPLTLVALLLIGVSRLGGARLLPVAAAAATLIFVLSASQSVVRGPEFERETERRQAIFADLTTIQKITRGKNVVVAQDLGERIALYGDRNLLDFYLSGSRVKYNPEAAPQARDYVVIPYRDEQFPLLTPDNEIVFLYGPADPADLKRARFDALVSSVSGEPAGRAAYDVHIGDGALVYVDETCDDIESKFFLHIFPESADDLPDWRRRRGYDSLDFQFPLWGVELDGKCAASVPLPEYEIASIRTGQSISGEREAWDTAFPFDPGAYRAAYKSAVSREPDARAEFDIYLDREARTLTYLKEPCAAPDVERPFFLHVTPERPGDLPADRKELGFDAHDFDFRLRGIVFDGKCVAQVPLPEYEIASIRTGQYISGERETWDVAFPFDPGAYRAAYEAASAREPTVRAAFDLHLDEEERTLTYVRKECAASDAAPPFFLHVTPERVDDLQEDRREAGFDSRDFDFRLRGIVFDGKCVAQVPLPEYGIASVRTGQWKRGEGEIWEASVPFGA